MHSEMSDAATPSTGVTSSRGTLSQRKLGSMRHPLSHPSKLFALPVIVNKTRRQSNCPYEDDKKLNKKRRTVVTFLADVDQAVAAHADGLITRGSDVPSHAVTHRGSRRTQRARTTSEARKSASERGVVRATRARIVAKGPDPAVVAPVNVG